MSKWITKTYTAPSSWASYLINGDASGLEADEQEQADAFQAEMNEQGFDWPVDCQDAGFLWWPDYGSAGDCQTYTFMKEAST